MAMISPAAAPRFLLRLPVASVRNGRPARLLRRGMFALILLLAVLGAALAPALPASAHAVLLRSNPAQNARLAVAPHTIQLFFSEPLDHHFSTIVVRNGSGERAGDKDVRFTS